MFVKPIASLRVFAANPPGSCKASIAIAAARSGHVGLLDLEFAQIAAPGTRQALETLVKAMRRPAKGQWGLKLRQDDLAAIASHPALIDGPQPGCVIVVPTEFSALNAAIAAAKAKWPACGVLVEIHDTADLAARLAVASLADGWVAKGFEAGGHVGTETIFLLVQRLRALTDLPVIAQGGVAPDTGAALFAAGVSGVLLDWQLALFDAAGSSVRLERALRSMDGSETRCLGLDLGLPVRVYWRADHAASRRLEAFEHDLIARGITGAAARAAFANELRRLVAAGSPDAALWLIGQDGAFAARFRAGHSQLGAALDALAARMPAQVAEAAAQGALAEGAALAQAHGTRFPIVQGPMTRVSDRAEFALAVAEGGALPFLALALMRAPEANALVAQTKEMLGARSWGVGILGFVDEELRAEQTQVILDHAPKFALIAGGRPDQAAALEAAGISTFLHVPSPGLLKLFLESGAKRFIFEGHECGGHVGPRTSFVLWQQAVDVLLEAFAPGVPMDVDLLFAGGVHDAVSAAMVAALAARLTARGARVGVLLGTAYLFTVEAVASGAIQQGYQDLVLRAEQTVLLESGPGHMTRVVDSPIVDEFRSEKARLMREGVTGEHLRDKLENFNIGRSRIASKGIDRNPALATDPKAPKFITISPADQIRLGVYMTGQVAGLHDSATTIAALHDTVSQGSQAVLLAAVVPARATLGTQVPSMEAPEGPGAGIAITGIGTILPRAQTAAQYWQNILDKVDTIEEVPARRWDWRRYYDTDRSAPDKIYSKWGGFLSEMAFDPLRYGIPPTSIPQIEPLQLLALEAVRQALEDAGYPNGMIPDPKLRRRTSVIIGVGGGAGPLGQRYAVRTAMPAIDGKLSDQAAARLPDWTEDSFPGILLNVIAGRVANRFDLGGVNFTVDAACGSSLAAVMLATRELEAGTSDMVIVGGVDSFQNPFDFVAFSKTRALSPRGRCRTFDASADGIAISEGLALVVLRRLEDVEAEGGRVYAVLRAAAGSSDGRDLSLTAPRAEGQQEALRRAYARAGISPGTVGMVEAHGTGTVVGDRTEIESLSKVFALARPDEVQFCGVGSVKSMIGHTKAAAGCAGLIKMALALHHQVQPATLNVTEPSPSANFPQSPFYVQTEARPWLRLGKTPRRAGVSAFGFGGTNFHVVLEEYDGGYLPSHQAPFRRDWADEVLMFSAADAPALAAVLDRAAAGLAQAPTAIRLADVAASLMASFDPAAQARLALVASAGDFVGLAARLTQAAQQLTTAPPPSDGVPRRIDPRGSFLACGPALTQDQVAFLFPGQGSQYPGMAAGLAMHFPQMRQTLEEASLWLSGKTPDALGHMIHPVPTLDPAIAQAQADALTRTDVAQPAIGAVSLGVLRILRDLGLEAGFCIGHSFGEYTALHAAGAFDAQTLLHLAHARGDAIVQTVAQGNTDLGTMAAVSAGAEAVRAALADGSGVVLANMNAPDQTVIAGPTPAIAAATDRLRAAGLTVQPLPVACGFHSDCVAPARAQLTEALAAAPIGVPDRPVYANATAAPYPAQSDLVRDQLAAHLVQPVNFVGSIQAMHKAGARLFVEVGPNGVLSRLTDRCLGPQDSALSLASDGRGKPGIAPFLMLVAGAAASGLPLTLDLLWAGRARRDLDVKGWDLAASLPKAPAITWMIDAANVRPAGGKVQKLGFTVPMDQDVIAVANPVAAPPAVMREHPMPIAAPLAGASPPAPFGQTETALPPADPALAEQMLRRHQELMSRFLDHNRDVMLAYLGGDIASPGAARPSAVAGLVPALPAPVAAAVLPLPAAPVVAASVAVVPAAIVPAALVPAAVPAAVFAAPAAALTPTLTPATVTAALRALIADRTGYPPEMLAEDLDLEADLGIDSIKRVEIVGALRLDLLPQTAGGSDAVREAMGPVARSRSIAQITEKFLHVAGTLNGPAVTAIPVSKSPAPQVVPTAQWDARFVMVAQATAPLAASAPPLAVGRYLISDDGAGLAQALAKALTDLGLRAEIVNADLPDADLRALVLGKTDLTGLFHLAPLRPLARGKDGEFVDWQAAVTRSSRGLYTLLSAAGPALLARQGAVVITASAMGGAFGFDGTLPENPAAGGAPGLLKAVAIEWPAVHCRALDFAFDTAPADRVKAILQEACHRSGPVEIGRRGTERLELLAEMQSLSALDPVLRQISAQDVIVVTGGARGITAQIARHLAKDAAAQFVLMGSTPMPDAAEPADVAGLTAASAVKAALIKRAQAKGQLPKPAEIEREWRALSKARDVRETLAALQALGAGAEYLACNVRDAAAFGAAIAGIRAKYGRIDGVLHGAGVIEDKLLADKTPDSFENVLHTKTDSAVTLATALGLLPGGPAVPAPGFVIFFTSVAGRFGNRGQGDYGAANETVSKLARWLQGQPQAARTRICAVSWGPWDTGAGGMVSPEIKAQFDAMGIVPIPQDLGVAAMATEIRHGAPDQSEVVWGEGPWARDAARLTPDALRRAAE